MGLFQQVQKTQAPLLLAVKWASTLALYRLSPQPVSQPVSYTVWIFHILQKRKQSLRATRSPSCHHRAGKGWTPDYLGLSCSQPQGQGGDTGVSGTPAIGGHEEARVTGSQTKFGAQGGRRLWARLHREKQTQVRLRPVRCSLGHFPPPRPPVTLSPPAFLPQLSSAVTALGPPSQMTLSAGNHVLLVKLCV